MSEPSPSPPRPPAPRVNRVATPRSDGEGAAAVRAPSTPNNRPSSTSTVASPPASRPQPVVTASATDATRPPPPTTTAAAPSGAAASSPGTRPPPPPASSRPPATTSPQRLPDRTNNPEPQPVSTAQRAKPAEGGEAPPTTLSTSPPSPARAEPAPAAASSPGSRPPPPPASSRPPATTSPQRSSAVGTAGASAGASTEPAPDRNGAASTSRDTATPPPNGPETARPGTPQQSGNRPPPHAQQPPPAASDEAVSPAPRTPSDSANLLPPATPEGEPRPVLLFTTCIDGHLQDVWRAAEAPQRTPMTQLAAEAQLHPRILRMFALYDPLRSDANVDEVMRQWYGREAQLLQSLVALLGPEPAAPVAVTAAGYGTEAGIDRAVESATRGHSGAGLLHDVVGHISPVTQRAPRRRSTRPPLLLEVRIERDGSLTPRDDAAAADARISSTAMRKPSSAVSYLYPPAASRDVAAVNCVAIQVDSPTRRRSQVYDALTTSVAAAHTTTTTDDALKRPYLVSSGSYKPTSPTMTDAASELLASVSPELSARVAVAAMPYAHRPMMMPTTTQRMPHVAL